MRIYNVPDKKVVDLEIDKTKPVKIYTCGPTVYDFPHVGNWYTFIRYDLLVRTLRASGYKVDWVMNITDVGHLVSDADEGEDKLEKGAKREGKTAWDVAKTYTDYFTNGLKRLNFSEVDHLPKATEYIDEQIALISKLEDGGYTYETTDGIYFDTSKFPQYADFAHLNLDGQKTGERVETTNEKRQESDFALWKHSPKGQKRDMEWESPWGTGFPGWHLECSAMIHRLLGEPIDIHAGGVDHINTHHTNEIAQSVAAYGVPLANYWMHCNHILVDGKKMSKSDGTFITLEDIEAKGYSLDVFRFHVLSGHYRNQSEFSWDSLTATRNRFNSWAAVASLRWQITEDNDPDLANELSNTQEAFKVALQNDLDTLKALKLVDYAFDNVVDPAAGQSITALKEFLSVLDVNLGIGLLQATPDIDDAQKELLKKRDESRDSKNWGESDRLRDELKKQGIEVKDTDSGQFWSRIV